MVDAGGRWVWDTLRVMSRNRVGFAGFVVVLAITAVSFLAPILIPFDPRSHVSAIYEGPSLPHPLGTDGQGRDTFIEVLNGGRDLLIVGYLAGALTTLAALTLGSLAGYLGGWVDSLLSWLADLFLTMPQFALLAVLAAFVRLNGNVGIALLLAVFGWPGLMRAIRSQVLSLKEREYVEAAQGLALGTPHIVFREIGPTMAGYVTVHLVLNVTAAMYASVGLIFLGFVPLSGTNWGVMLNLAQGQGQLVYRNSVWYVMAPMIAIVLFQLAMLSMSRSLTEVFDPRLRRRR
jgi:peptide/nickel transport system permease protein